MKLLLSGFIGAIFATLINVFWNHINNVIRLRGNTFLEIVRWTDSVYQRMIYLYSAKKDICAGLQDVDLAIYSSTSRELNNLMFDSSKGALIALTFGEGKELEMFSNLNLKLKEAADLIRKTYKDNLKVNDVKIRELFENEIDPKKIELQQTLLNKTKLKLVICEYFNRKK